MNDRVQTTSMNGAEIGSRLRAYRIGAGLRAEQVAELLGISRAAVYRMEKGEIVKIETLERLAVILRTSLASMLGVGTEYYSSALAYIERMRQLEQGATRIMAHFEPVSFLLTSSGYIRHLEQMLRESEDSLADDRISALMSLLQERKREYASHPAPIVSLIGLRELERFVHFGLIGRMDLPPSVKMERSLAARAEVTRIAALLEDSPLDMQIGIVDESMPNSTFQIFERPSGAYVAVSPFRFGEFPNISCGIASVTAAPEAVALYSDMVATLWKRAYKGKEGAAILRKMLQQV
ncbi:DNA-binding protein [Massilia sp. Root133]|jgi:transcriptional regulator with XRE-family HTH domain|uniref:Helix-turn-helix domain-containing protein n=1 Tax=Massilia cellulosiltytica TaxID=2683234 RepID=A0A7X3FX16_9BURK|nr:MULTISPECIES: helix-turn-helix transcriptional regulator [Telluria group]KQX98240.1 DNA-binding protein [Massilia sp. Root133]KQZ46924.1 DNA-binding protein [Massilia sp. Root1485]MVW59610.1 helix-turn-helix domain-containing protein [Telluria cellulosilytica]